MRVTLLEDETSELLIDWIIDGYIFLLGESFEHGNKYRNLSKLRGKESSGGHEQLRETTDLQACCREAALC